MHQKNKKTIPKKYTLILIVSLVAVAAITWYLYGPGRTLPRKSPASNAVSNSTNLSDPTDEQVSNGAAIKSNSVNNDSSKNTASGSDQPLAPENQGNSKSLVQVTITATNQVESILQIRALVSALDSTGSCSILLERPGEQTITLKSGVHALSNTSTCQGFDIPTASLPPGDWTISITYESDRYFGSTTQTVMVK